MIKIDSSFLYIPLKKMQYTTYIRLKNLHYNFVSCIACFLSIPKHLARDYKKFRYSLVVPSGSSRKYAGSLMWLYDAGIINFCYNYITLNTILLWKLIFL